MIKTPIPTENSTTNEQHKNATKTSITQRLRTDLQMKLAMTYTKTMPSLARVWYKFIVSPLTFKW